jgi:cell fate regulator YaaT (PSP1 superfamily)
VSLPLPVFQPLPDLRELPRVVEVAFKGTRRAYFRTTDPDLRVGDPVLVEVERGRDLGRVRSVGGVAAKKCASCKGDGSSEEDAAPAERVLRRAEPAELEALAVLRVDEERVRRTTREMVEQHGLKMKVSEVEWQWDRNKLTIYFTAERRVDFRQLVRDLARTFRTRIELKQIGVRDEAALLGGVGRCGRELCCSTWLREIKPISLQLAKGPEPVAQPHADLRHLRPADVLPHLRARRLPGRPQALPARGQDGAHLGGQREGDRHRHLEEPGDAAGREPPAPRGGAGRAPRGDGRRRARPRTPRAGGRPRRAAAPLPRRAAAPRAAPASAATAAARRPTGTGVGSAAMAAE